MFVFIDVLSMLQLWLYFCSVVFNSNVFTCCHVEVLFLFHYLTLLFKILIVLDFYVCVFMHKICACIGYKFRFQGSSN